MAKGDGDGVGYGRPPRSRQFKKGQSGNPKGRPKGSRNFATVISTELNSRMPINENGKRRNLTKREIIAKQLVNKALGGDPKSIPILLNETRAHDAEKAEKSAPHPVSPQDSAVIEGIIERLRAADAARKDGTSSPTREIPADQAGPTDETPTNNSETPDA